MRELLKIFLCGFLSLWFLFSHVEAKEPSALYLTWTHDPATTMVIQWHTLPKENRSDIFFQESGLAEWKTQEGSSKRLKRHPISVHTVELTELKPDTEYTFRIGKEKSLYRFRTLPANNDRPLRFVIGGDAYYHLTLFKKMNEQIAKINPDFIVVGGDLSYAENLSGLLKGKQWRWKRWETFFKFWKKQMITADGRLIPIIPILGNHDIQSKKPDQLLFYDLFAFPEKNTSYRAIDFGDYFSLIILDTAHHHAIEGKQTAWLQSTLEERASVPLKLAAYHVSAYPSFYSFDNKTPVKIRAHWIPLFEKYNIKAAFEHHNHAFKRTHPLKNNQIDPDGILYLGDGSWGVPSRFPLFSTINRWYMAKAEFINACWLVTLQKDKAILQALNNKGTIFDEVSLPTTNSLN